MNTFLTDVNKENTILLTPFKIHMYERCSHVIGKKPIYIHQTFYKTLSYPGCVKDLEEAFQFNFKIQIIQQ